MPSVGPRGNNWCFTMNNYTPADVDRLATPIEGVRYLIFGREVGASGTPHLQGTVCFESRKRLPQVISTIGQAHCSLTRFLSSSIEYCKKDGDFTEWGTAPKTKKGERSDLEDFKNSVKEGLTDLKELRELHSSVMATYSKFAMEYLRDQRPVVRVEGHPLKEWQSELWAKLRLSPNNREIMFFVDRTGDTGKTWFAQYYCDTKDDGQHILPGKKADMIMALDETKRVFFMDCPRSKQGEFIQYDFLEELKNGYVFNGKYESRHKRLKTPHIVVFMNEEPDMSKLSADRYNITRL